ncbi:ribbon-helix-helix protein, CopG family [Streptomyces sp. V4-01]|uniref:Ribbon-helix-helix protein, CopG family n=1 Tax=Actinacidiphila polyblastidii TaxID=3110430 RepID=A0ABU7PI25_9ACTN|nr:ribbon-helix-helix protein, CopG family [Streptomyces sp. V4-01]
MASRVLSLRIDADLWDRISRHAAKRGMSAQDYVARTLIRDDFDERFMAAVEETDRFYGREDAQTRPSAGIR